MRLWHAAARFLSTPQTLSSSPRGADRAASYAARHLRRTAPHPTSVQNMAAARISSPPNAQWPPQVVVPSPSPWRLPSIRQARQDCLALLSSLWTPPLVSPPQAYSNKNAPQALQHPLNHPCQTSHTARLHSPLLITLCPAPQSVTLGGTFWCLLRPATEEEESPAVVVAPPDEAGVLLTEVLVDRSGRQARPPPPTPHQY